MSLRISTAKLGTVNETTSNARVYGYSALIRIGAGMFIQTGFSVTQAKVSPARQAHATSFMSWAQNLGIMLSLAISGAVFQANSISNLQKILPNLSRMEIRAAISGNNSSIFKQLDEITRTKVLHAIVDAMSRTYYLVVTAGIMAILGALGMKVTCIGYPCWIVQLADIVIAGTHFCRGCSGSVASWTSYLIGF